MSENKAAKKQSTVKKVLTLGCLVPFLCMCFCILVAGLLAENKPKSEAVVTAKPELTEWQKYKARTERCMIGWTFSANPKPCYRMRKSIEAQLKDPESFKYIEARCNFTRDSLAASFRDTVTCFVEFTATNSFGGRVRNTADVKMVLPPWSESDDGSCEILQSKILQ